MEELIFIANNRGSILVQENFFLWYSDYYRLYHKTLHSLMNEEGIMPVTWRYFIAIMAVSTMRSEYLLIHLQQTFLLKGGDENWLIYGLEIVPEKLKRLGKVNNYLAHQPWKLSNKDINEIIQSNKNTFSKDEFVEASLILINYHRLASITESLKIKIKDKIQDNENTKIALNTVNVDLEGKNKLYNNLIEMNEEKENEKTSNRKFSGDDVKIMSYNDEGIKTVKFEKYISNYCTLYIDFDNYSETKLSSFV
jgi:sestrin